jgi:hypothetical protein
MKTEMLTHFITFDIVGNEHYGNCFFNVESYRPHANSSASRRARRSRFLYGRGFGSAFFLLHMKKWGEWM